MTHRNCTFLISPTHKRAMPRIKQSRKKSSRRISKRSRRQTGRGLFGMTKSDKEKLKSWKASNQSYRDLMEAYHNIDSTPK